MCLFTFYLNNTLNVAFHVRISQKQTFNRQPLGRSGLIVQRVVAVIVERISCP